MAVSTTDRRNKEQGRKRNQSGSQEISSDLNTPAQTAAIGLGIEGEYKDARALQGAWQERKHGHGWRYNEGYKSAWQRRVILMTGFERGSTRCRTTGKAGAALHPVPSAWPSREAAAVCSCQRLVAFPSVARALCTFPPTARPSSRHLRGRLRHRLLLHPRRARVLPHQEVPQYDLGHRVPRGHEVQQHPVVDTEGLRQEG